MKIIRDPGLNYFYDCRQKPIAEVESGETFVFESRDCYSDRYFYEDQDIAQRHPGYRANPMVGPVTVKGVDKGDVLKIEIKDIQFKEGDPIPEMRISNPVELGDHATMVLRKDFGRLRDELDDFSIKIMPIRDGKLHFNDKLDLPLNPHAGAIAVGIDGDPIYAPEAGEYGGNMDCKLLGKGATLYLPVFMDGAMLYGGDLHAVMSDGENAGMAAEVPGFLTVRATGLKECRLPAPCMANDTVFAIICTENTLDEAADRAIHSMYKFLHEEVGLEKDDAVRLLSLACDQRICQVVGSKMTIRIEVPLWILEKYNYQLP